MSRNNSGTLTVLIVEDDNAMANLIRTYLEHAGYSVLAAETGEEGIELAQRHRPHLILLDLMLPLLSGWETCRALRARVNVPIIMVTARRAEADRLRGFAEGADDYVVKPFSPRELVARIGAVLRRQQVAPSQVLSVGMISIDPLRREARVSGNPVLLREREFDLLLYLALHVGEVCARATLLDHVWGYDFEGDERTIDSHVRRLRDALERTTLYCVGHWLQTCRRTSMRWSGWRQPRDLRSRLALTITAVGLLALLINAVLLSVFLNAYLIDRQGTLLARQATAIGQCCTQSHPGPLFVGRQSLARAMGELLAGTPNRRALVVHYPGNILYASPMPAAERSLLLARLLHDLANTTSPGVATWHQVGNQIISDVKIPIKQSALEQYGGLLLADPVDAVGAQWQRVIALVLLAGGVSLALAVLAGILAAQVLSRSLRAATKAARSVAAGDYSVRVHPDGPSETVELAEAFNMMIDEVLHQRQVERDLLANVSHELGGPLGLIQGYTEGLADGVIASERERQRALQTIHDETTRLRRLTGDLLDLALLETGQVAVQVEPVPIAELLIGLQERFAPMARPIGVQLRVEAETNLPLLYTDGLRLESVLVNLIQNALRYTPPGGSITLCASHCREAMQLIVADTGCGISAKDLPHIWERFYRVDRGRDRRQSGAGLGLGLAICRSTIALLGGTIGVESTLQQGTTFTIGLPFRAA